jgi:hypothetical protein
MGLGELLVAGQRLHQVETAVEHHQGGAAAHQGLQLFGGDQCGVVHSEISRAVDPMVLRYHSWKCCMPSSIGLW